MALKETHYENVAALNTGFAEKIVSLLAQGIAQNGKASLVVSGGRTPQAMFNELSQADLDWSKVDITLADERWVIARMTPVTKKWCAITFWLIRRHQLISSL